MTKTSEVITALRNSIRGEAAIQEFSNSNLTPERSRQQAASLLGNKRLPRNVLGLTPEDQTRFVDKVDQVCRNGSFSSND